MTHASWLHSSRPYTLTGQASCDARQRLLMPHRAAQIRTLAIGRDVAAGACRMLVPPFPRYVQRADGAGGGGTFGAKPAARHCAPVVHASQRHVSGLLVRGEGSEELKRKSKEEYFATIFQEPETLEPHNIPVNITCNRL